MHSVQLDSLGIKSARIGECIYLIHGQNRGRSPYSNSILVTGERNILLDAGCGLETLQKILKGIAIDTVILSHCHPDHTSGTWLVHESTGALIAAPGQSADAIGSMDRLAKKLVGNDLADEWCSTYLPAIGYRDFSPGRTYSDGDEFFSGTVSLKAVHAPGHIDDHYCLWEPEKKILFGFDIDLSPFGPWYGNDESDTGFFMQSIESVIHLPFETYVSSHAKPMSRTHALKRLAAYASVIEERDRLILGLLPRGKNFSADDITWLSPIYGCLYREKMDRVLFYGESRMVMKHLERLAEKGLLSRDGDDFIAGG
jgi:glyoxylase-like metal-dependent hydrolase (beta-lactamase superfamily II)